VSPGSQTAPPPKERKPKVRAEAQTATTVGQEKPKEIGGSCTLDAGNAQTTFDLAETNRANGNYDVAIRQYEKVEGCPQFSARAQRGLDKARAAQHH
jgi:hypothetical protein